MISHAAALPTQVVMPSIVWRKLWTLMGGSRPSTRRLEGPRDAIRSVLPDGVPAAGNASELGRGGVRAEIVVNGHPAVGHGVLLPTRHPFGEGDLRVEDLPEDRIVRRLLLRNLVVNLELPLQDRIRCLVEFDP